MPGPEAASEHHELLIVGGGNAGISLAARLLRDGARDVAVVESQPVHRYRPLLNYVGAGEATMASLEKPAADVMPDGCTWIRAEVVAVDLRRPQRAACLACDPRPDRWTSGLHGAARARTLWCDSTEAAVHGVRPPAPRRGVAPQDVHLVLPERSPLGVPTADRVLEETLASYGVQVLREARVTRLEDRRVIVTGSQGAQLIDDVTYAHVVPHYRAPGWVTESGLAGVTAGGLVDVDPATLRHRKHRAVWSLGDVAGVATRPSGGALRKQVDVLADNLAAEDDASMRRYDGYTVMPITVSRRRLMLVEVDREGRAVPTVRFPDLVRPRRTTWWVDRHALPATYWRRILRGKV